MSGNEWRIRELKESCVSFSIRVLELEEENRHLKGLLKERKDFKRKRIEKSLEDIGRVTEGHGV